MYKIDREAVRIKIVFSQTLYSQSVASVSMGSLAAHLRMSGFQADLCFLDKGDLVSFETRLGDGDYIVIAKPNFKDFSVMFPLLERLKSFGGTKRIFLCGPFAQLNADKLMSQFGWLDGIFVDQLEASSVRLLSTMSEDFVNWDLLSPGSISRDTKSGLVGGHVPLSAPIPLSNIPSPARDIEMMEDVSYVNIEASRGCLFNCSFCHIPLVSKSPRNGSSLNVRDPVLVVDEIERLNKELGKTLFIFNDSCFWGSEKDDARILRFCEEIARRKLDVRFYVYMRGEPFIGDKVLLALVKAGLVRIFLGIENHTESSLVRFRKKIGPNSYEILKKKLDPLGVNIHIGYITFEPHSSLDDVLSNIEYLSDIGKLFRLGVILEPVRVIPGTILHSELIKEGLMSSGLSFNEVTYGYRFEHEEVGRLLREWKGLFEGHLKKVAYRFEYYSTVSDILKILSERLDPRFSLLLNGRYKMFRAKRLEGMNLLLEYFRSSIDSVRHSMYGSVVCVKQNRRFTEEFTQVTEALGVLYGDIVSFVRENDGERAVREVYMEVDTQMV